MKRNPVLTCFMLAFILSWGLIILTAGPANFPIDPARSADMLPMLYVLMLTGPFIAGLLMTGLVYGKAGLISIGKRLLKWRVSIKWYVVALFAAPALASLILLILSLFNRDFHPVIFSAGGNAGAVLSGMMIGLMVGLFEEIGWSGFAIPTLRKKYSIVNTGLIVGMVWGAWHFILFWEAGSFGATLPFLILIGRLFAWLPPFRIIMVWMLDRTGSMLLVILFHASLVFATTVIVPMDLAGRNLLIWLIIWGMALWLMALVVTRAGRGNLNGKMMK